MAFLRADIEIETTMCGNWYKIWFWFVLRKPIESASNSMVSFKNVFSYDIKLILRFTEKLLLTASLQGRFWCFCFKSLTAKLLPRHCQLTKAVVWRCFLKKVLLDVSQNSQENTCAGVCFFSCEFCEISETTFFTEHFCWLLPDWIFVSLPLDWYISFNDLATYCNVGVFTKCIN